LCVIGRFFDSRPNNFVTSVGLGEVCGLLSAVLVNVIYC